eukprot:CAMPEP_0176254294 /NCGR_PEP_ID=MMETSP0121_2-20121125/36458_1 /TAXON_ID=160619 /ORGANISM="Kryptoperidinium foliaceum, Strain CCMP 1326" /LENGTH=344 /DNA_ID=CAMNT_0017594099 /DNA_START=18 /DNA_END=1053 /DNA_ORIENTATION=+
MSGPGPAFFPGERVSSLIDFDTKVGSIKRGDIGVVRGPSTGSDRARVNVEFPGLRSVNMLPKQIRWETTTTAKTNPSAGTTPDAGIPEVAGAPEVSTRAANFIRARSGSSGRPRSLWSSSSSSSTPRGAGQADLAPPSRASSNAPRAESWSSPAGAGGSVWSQAPALAPSAPSSERPSRRSPARLSPSPREDAAGPRGDARAETTTPTARDPSPHPPSTPEPTASPKVPAMAFSQRAAMMQQASVRTAWGGEREEAATTPTGNCGTDRPAEPVPDHRLAAGSSAGSTGSAMGSETPAAQRPETGAAWALDQESGVQAAPSDGGGELRAEGSPACHRRDVHVLHA